MNNKSIFVTQPSLASLKEFTDILEEAWLSGVLTHNGPLVQRFEKELSKKLNIDDFVTVTNGTIAIQMAIRALEIKGDIITTPFTWIATVSAIRWEGCNPVFCDIDKDTLNIDPMKIEELITDKTVAIMPVHVFGNPCDVEIIESIAKKHGLKVIYDGAHAIGSTINGKSVLENGDITTTSLHATKLLNSGEGGGCISRNSIIRERLKRIRFFGHNVAKDVVDNGLNGKMTEIHAALGIANLKYYDVVLADREFKYFKYLNSLSRIKKLKFQKILIGKSNYSYFPIIFPTESDTLDVVLRLNNKNIFPRRYFYPSVNTYDEILDYQECEISEDISKRILCLPLYFNIKEADIDIICNTIIEYFQ